MVVEIKDQNMGDGMQCSNHPYTKNPGGICAFCLQEKLGKLVSSSFPLPKPVSSSSSSSSSPSFRCDSVGSSTVAGNLSSASLSLSLSVAKGVSSSGSEGYYCNNNMRATKLPFLLPKKKKKIMAAVSANSADNIVYRRSKSTTTPRTAYGEDFSPRKRGGFWSFLHLSSSKHQNNNISNNNSASTTKVVEKIRARTTQTENGSIKADKIEARTTQTESGSSSLSKNVGSSRNGISVIVEEDGSPNIATTEAANGSGSSFERKVSRSRSVGCGSRSFSGDFFERISNGFGDCTLRRVESQREGKPKVSSSNNNPNVGSASGMRDMVRCGGIFGGFMIMTSSSSSSATWVSSASASASSASADQHHHDVNGIKPGSLIHGRNRSWAWAFASPMRAVSSTTTNKASSAAAKDGKRGRVISESNSKNTAPNLDAIPSLLAVRS